MDHAVANGLHVWSVSMMLGVPSKDVSDRISDSDFVFGCAVGVVNSMVFVAVVISFLSTWFEEWVFNDWLIGLLMLPVVLLFHVLVWTAVLEIQIRRVPAGPK